MKFQKIIFFFNILIFFSVQSQSNWSWEDMFKDDEDFEFFFDKQNIKIDYQEKSIIFYNLINFDENKEVETMKEEKVNVKSSIVLNKLNCKDLEMKHLELKFYKQKEGIDGLGEFTLESMNLPTESFIYPSGSSGMRVSKTLCKKFLNNKD